MKASNIILTVCIVLGVLFLCGLGAWQVKRLVWKETLIARVQDNMNSHPLTVSQVEAMINEGKDIEYRPASISGTFLHEGEAHFFATHKGKPGYFVFTPLQQADGRFMLVNRGYVPMEMKDRSLRTQGLVDGVVTITGLARSAPTQRPNDFVPDNDLVKNVFYWKSMPQMLDYAVKMTGNNAISENHNRYFIDANDAPVPGGLPEGGVTLIKFPNNHLQYAVTWFGLASVLMIVGGMFLLSRIRQSASETA